MNTEVLRNICAKRHKDWKFPWYILDISNLAGSKLTRCCVCLFSLQHTSYKADRFGCGNVQDEKTIELSWNAHPFNSTENNRDDQLVYKQHIENYSFKVLDSNHSWKKNEKVFSNNTKVINRVFIRFITDWTQTKLIKAKTYWQTKWMFHINKSFHLIHF